jgi:peptidoglycan lytic transglycosylase G
MMRLRSPVTKIVIPSLALVVAVAAGFGLWLRREVRRPHAHAAAGQVVTIEPGAGTGAIISRLHRAGILARGWPTELWLKTVARGRSLKAGDYEFKSPIAPLAVIDKLVRGEVATRHLTIPEGYNQFDIARLLAGLQGVREPPPEDALALLKKTALVADLDPGAATLEGYLFPDTYEYTPATTREQLVEAMVRRFRRVYTPEMQGRAAELGMTTRQAVTLASLIEEEAKVDAERELISQVYHRRLKLGMALACDPTVIYAALLAGRYRGKIYRSDLDYDSPYNTYRRAGLPPGPIASPGRRSLAAALRPAETEYLYFVVDPSRPDGSHIFTTNPADHGRAVAALRQWERDQKQ